MRLAVTPGDINMMLESGVLLLLLLVTKQMHFYSHFELWLTGPPAEPHDSWRVAAITSFSVLAAVVVFGALLIGVLVHQCRSKRTLSGKT